MVGSRKRSLSLADSIRLIRLDCPTAKRLLGISRLSLSDDGFLKSKAYRDDASWWSYRANFRSNDPNQNFIINSANFLLAVDNRKQAESVAFAMKLIAPTRSGPYFGFSADADQFHLLSNCPYSGKGILNIDPSAHRKLKEILRLLHAKDKKLETIVEKFGFAVSNGRPTRLRFFELATILEMLFLPTQSSELSYRFRLRIAKWFKRHCGADPLDYAAKAKRIYDLRCEIAHQGTAAISEEALDDVSQITRRAIMHYLRDRAVFDDGYLDRLCLLN